MIKAEFLENGRNKIIDKSNQEFFTDIAKKFAGYDELLDVDDRCKNNNLNVCEFSGKRNGYQYRINISRRDDVTNVGLNVRKGGFVDNVN